jgi:hypothetical protein
MVTNVLLRGRSLTEFKTLDSPDIVFLVNDMDREVEEVNGLKEYLLDKEINLVFNMVTGADRGYQEIGFFETFNVTKLVRPYVTGDRQPGSSGQSINLPDEFLGEHHKKFMYEGSKYPYEYPGTGIAAIAYAILDCKFDVVNIVGLDFYDNLFYGQSNYLVQDNAGRDYWTDLSELQVKNPELQTKRLDLPDLDDWQYKIQNTLCDLVEHKPNIQVNLKTKCKSLIPRMTTYDNLNIEVIK